MAKYNVWIKETSYVCVEVEFEDGVIPSDDSLKDIAIDQIQNGFGRYADCPDYEFIDKEIIKDYGIS